MTIYEFITTRNKPDIAGILAASAYAIRESISLFASLEEMGFFFEEVEIDELVQDISDDFELSRLSAFCSTQLMLVTSIPFSQE